MLGFGINRAKAICLEEQLMAECKLSTLATTIKLRPRYAETDQMGIVYHANYLIWFHEARDALLQALGVDIQQAEAAGYSFPVIKSCCTHQSPAHYGEEVTVTAVPVINGTGVTNVARLQLYYRVTAARNRRLIAEGETINVITNLEGRLLLRIPDLFENLVRQIETAYQKAKGTVL